MKYLGDSFSVYPGSEKNYRDNYDKIFGKKDKSVPETEQPKSGPKKMSDLPAPREVQVPLKAKKPKIKKPKNEKPKAKTKKKAK